MKIFKNYYCFNMKWFQIHFNEANLSGSLDERLIKEFIALTHKLHHPEELAMYQLKFRVEDGLVMYILTNDIHSSKLKSILAHFQYEEVSRPNLKVLKLILGKGILFE